MRLSAIRATAAEVQGELLRLLAGLVVNDELAYRHPAVVAGVGTPVRTVIVALVVVFGGWARFGCGRVIHGGLLGRLSGLRGSYHLPAGAFLFD